MACANTLAGPKVSCRRNPTPQPSDIGSQHPLWGERDAFGGGRCRRSTLEDAPCLAGGLCASVRERQMPHSASSVGSFRHREHRREHRSAIRRCDTASVARRAGSRFVQGQRRDSICGAAIAANAEWPLRRSLHRGTEGLTLPSWRKVL